MSDPSVSGIATDANKISATQTAMINMLVIVRRFFLL